MAVRNSTGMMQHTSFPSGQIHLLLLILITGLPGVGMNQKCFHLYILVLLQETSHSEPKTCPSNTISSVRSISIFTPKIQFKKGKIVNTPGNMTLKPLYFWMISFQILYWSVSSLSAMYPSLSWLRGKELRCGAEVGSLTWRLPPPGEEPLLLGFSRLWLITSVSLDNRHHLERPEITF